MTQLVAKIDEVAKAIPSRNDLDAIEQLIEMVATDQNEIANVDVFSLFSKEPCQQIFVDKLDLLRIQKETTYVRLAREKFEVVLIAFKCILESRLM